MNPTPHSSPRTRCLPLKMLCLAVAGPLLTSAAQAQDNDGYWTFGIGAVQTLAEFDERALGNRNSTTVPPNAVTSLSIATDRRDAGGKVFLGRRFNGYVRLRLGYFDLSKFGWRTTTLPTGTLTSEI